MTPWIETVSGIKFEFLNPKPEQINLEDIAHALSMTCRYTGHCRQFYSVAEHSALCSLLLPNELKLAGLLHDASEAYITDVASPIKEHLTNYQAIEDKIMGVVAEKYGFEYPLHPAVKHVDRVMLSTEAWHLLPSQGKDWDMWGWPSKRPMVDQGIKPFYLAPKQAYDFFMKTYQDLFDGKERAA